MSDRVTEPTITRDELDFWKDRVLAVERVLDGMSVPQYDDKNARILTEARVEILIQRFRNPNADQAFYRMGR